MSIYRFICDQEFQFQTFFQIKPPKRLTEAQREAIIEFAKDENFAGTINEEQSKGFFSKIKDKAKEFKN